MLSGSRPPRWAVLIVVVVAACSSPAGHRDDLSGEGHRLGPDRITHEAIADGSLSLAAVRGAGLRVFATPFSSSDGYGDGPLDPADAVSPGGRPTLQGNGTFLRVNGLDGQTCLECHSVVSAATVPATFGVGGVGGSVANAMFQPTAIDVCDAERQGLAGFDGRFINPPFLFGSGGIELLAAEMTADLQELRRRAFDQPGTEIRLVTHDVDFGTIVVRDGILDVSRIEGVDPDLVVRPFGRKGEFATVRAFDVEAMPFHFGMQPVETVGAGVDGDGDGTADEITVGEISALHVFNTTLERPVVVDHEGAERGAVLFEQVGCASCHRPQLTTRGRELVYRYPEVAEDPFANEYLRVDLSASTPGFDRSPEGGLVIPLYADLKRHDMGDRLAESFGSDLDRFFTTARLWGVADTAPYLHDGRATTPTEAILFHGGEAEDARIAFEALSQSDRDALLALLRSLRTPTDPARGVSAG
jgi:hypothetical protein